MRYRSHLDRHLFNPSIGEFCVAGSYNPFIFFMRPALLQRYKHRRCNEYDRDYVRLQAPFLTQD